MKIYEYLIRPVAGFQIQRRNKIICPVGSKLWISNEAKTFKYFKGLIERRIEKFTEENIIVFIKPKRSETNRLFLSTVIKTKQIKL